MKFILFFLCTIVALATSAQGKLDSTLTNEKKSMGASTHSMMDSVNRAINSKLINIESPIDSASRTAILKADSIRTSFQSKADSLQLAFQQPINKLDSVSRGIQHKVDSLQALGRSGRKLLYKYKAKMDSVTRAKTQKITELNKKVEHLKSKATAGLKEINLPPQLQGPVKNLEQSIQGYKIPMVNGKIPNLNLSTGSIPGVQLPGKLNLNSPGNIQLPGVNTGINSSLNGLTNETKELSAVTKQVSGYGSDVQNIAKGDIDQVKNLDKAAENELLKTEGLKELKGNSAELSKYQKQLSGRPDSAALNMLKQKGMKELTKEGTNHFAGQEQVLTSAMSQLSKLKKKYSSLQGLEYATKRRPNEMKGKPLIERIIPGLTLQFMSGKDMIIDFNPSLAYRFSGKLNVGLGWVDRVAIHEWQTNRNNPVYGLRSFGEYKLIKGFAFRADVESLNALMPPINPGGGPVDTSERTWGMNIFAGIKKEFKVFKNIQGNAQMLYRLWNEHYQAPYPDRLTVRMGFEFPMKKKRAGPKH